MANSSSMTVAWALACFYDSNGRSVVGHVNWVPKRLTNAATRNAVDTDNCRNTPQLISLSSTDASRCPLVAIASTTRIERR
jgi:hypothetical protein